MKRPGEWLRSLAARVCSVTTMERLIDPVIADMQCEHADASSRGSRWRCAWVRIAGSLAFWRAIGAFAIERAVDRTHEWAAADDWAMGRMLGGSTVVTVAITCLVAMLTLMMNIPAQFKWLCGGRCAGGTARMLLYLVPSAIPIAVPAGLLVGIVYGLRGRRATGRLRRAIFLVVMGGALAAFAWVDRVVPAANQAFRVVASGIPYDRLPKGANELTFGELAQKIAESNGSLLGSSRELSGTSPAPAAVLRFWYHARIAISITPIIVGLFALRLASVGRRRLSRAIGGTALTAYFAFYFAYDFTWLIEANHWGPLVVTSIAWLPNLFFLSGTLLLKTHSHDAAALPTQSG
jgi:hypothetical protein